jgi:mRNA interferase MazF
MSVRRGNVVLVDYPFSAGGTKVRRALVVQNDRDNLRLLNTIIVQLSSNTSRVHLATQHLIVKALEPGSELMRDSGVIATNLLALYQGDVLRVLGQLSAEAMKHVDDCLRAALDIL